MFTVGHAGAFPVATAGTVATSVHNGDNTASPVSVRGLLAGGAVMSTGVLRDA